MENQITIVGGGIIGSATAYFLSLEKLTTGLTLLLPVPLTLQYRHAGPLFADPRQTTRTGFLRSKILLGLF